MVCDGQTRQVQEETLSQRDKIGLVDHNCGSKGVKTDRQQDWDWLTVNSAGWGWVWCQLKPANNLFEAGVNLSYTVLRCIGIFGFPCFLFWHLKKLHFVFQVLVHIIMFPDVGCAFRVWWKDIKRYRNSKSDIAAIFRQWLLRTQCGRRTDKTFMR